MRSDRVSKSANKKLLIAALITLSFALMYFLLGRVYFETNDDETLNLLLAGAYGERTSFLIFQNIIIGRIISFLFSVVPSVNWYLGLMLAANTIAVFLICAALSSRLDLTGTVLTSLLINFTLGHDFYEELQFTRNASLYVAAGALMLLWAWTKLRDKAGFPLPQVMAGSLFFALGYMVRDNSFFAVLPFIALVFVWEMVLACSGRGRIGRGEGDRGGDLKERGIRNEPGGHGEHGGRSEIIGFKDAFIGAVKVWILPLILLAAVYLVNGMAYRSDPKWRDSKVYNDVRSELLDFGLPSYEENREEMEALGIDDTDLRLLGAWCYADPEKYTLETLEGILELRGGNAHRMLKFDSETVMKVFHGIADTLTTRYCGAILALIFIVSALILGRRHTLPFILCSLGILGEYWLLTCMGRVIWRVETGLWLLPAMLFFFLLLGGGYVCVPRLPRTVLIPAAIIFSLQLGSLLHTFFIEKGGRWRLFAPSFENYFLELEAVNEGDPKEVLAAGKRGSVTIYRPDLIPEDTYPRMICMVDTLTIASRAITPDLIALNSSFAGGLFKYTLFAGGWAGGSPAGDHYEKIYGISNPLRALAEDERMFFADVCGTTGYLVDYLRKEYDPDVTVAEVAMIDGISIWKFVRKEAGDEKN